MVTRGQMRRGAQAGARAAFSPDGRHRWTRPTFPPCCRRSAATAPHGECAHSDGGAVACCSAPGARRGWCLRACMRALAQVLHSARWCRRCGRRRSRSARRARTCSPQCRRQLERPERSLSKGRPGAADTYEGTHRAQKPEEGGVVTGSGRNRRPGHTLNKPLPPGEAAAFALRRSLPLAERRPRRGALPGAHAQCLAAAAANAGSCATSSARSMAAPVRAFPARAQPPPPGRPHRRQLWSTPLQSPTQSKRRAP